MRVFKSLLSCATINEKKKIHCPFLSNVCSVCSCSTAVCRWWQVVPRPGDEVWWGLAAAVGPYVQQWYTGNAQNAHARVAVRGRCGVVRGGVVAGQVSISARKGT